MIVRSSELFELSQDMIRIFHRLSVSIQQVDAIANSLIQTIDYEKTVTKLRSIKNDVDHDTDLIHQLSAATSSVAENYMHCENMVTDIAENSTRSAEYFTPKINTLHSISGFSADIKID